jgi:hypothetical protein
MPMPQEVGEIISYLQRIIEATRTGTMQWSKPNPSTFVWASQNPAARIILQSIDRPAGRQVTPQGIRNTIVKSYLLQALEGPQNNERIRITIDAADNPQLAEPLRTLYDTIQNSVTRAGLQFLDSILPHS